MLTEQGWTTTPNADANLRERVLHRLRLDIMSGESAPGLVYSVPALSRALGVSTTPVREALLQLTADGLLQPLRNRGFRVVDPSLDELRNLFEVRVQLETSAFVRLVRDGAVRGEDLAARADDIATAVEVGDAIAYLAADRAFHRELLFQAGNDVLAEIVMRLRDRMRLYGIRSPAGLARQRASVEEHYRIVDIARGRIEGEPAWLMKHHIMTWEPIFSQAIRERLGKVGQS